MHVLVYSCITLHIAVPFASTYLKRSTLQCVDTVSGRSSLSSLLAIFTNFIIPLPSYRCVRRMLMQSPHCPICKAGLPPQNPIHPNFSCKFEGPLCLFNILACTHLLVHAVNDLVTKYKLQKVGSAKRRCNSDEGRRLLEAVSSASDEGKD